MSSLAPALADAILHDLARDEGEVLHAYEDSEGFLTIGIGRLIDRRRGGGITSEEARYLLRNDVARTAADLDAKLPWWRGLSEPRQRVLLNMAFNLGIGDTVKGSGLLGFRNTLAAVKRGDYETAAKGMLASKWARQVGARAERLAALMRSA